VQAVDAPRDLGLASGPAANVRLRPDAAGAVLKSDGAGDLGDLGTLAVGGNIRRSIV
jgi:hypothetical protein